MIVEKLTFRAKFGQGDAVVAAFTEFRDTIAPQFGVPARVLVDVTGPMFTIVVESEYRDMDHVAEMERRNAEFFGSAQFQTWFGKWHGATEHGTRELFRVVD